MIAHNPLHGSGQAEFPHPALALGEDAQAMQGIGMTDGRHGQPASDEAPHAVPEYAAVLTAPRQRRVLLWQVPLRPALFPPSLPQPVARLCSGTSQVLQGCPTSHVRSLSAYVLRLPDASQGNRSLGRTWDLPVPERGVCVRARGL